MTDKQKIIDGVDVSGCYQYMPRYMEDYDIDTLDYCRYHFKPCKDVDVKYCYFKQLKRKEQEYNKLYIQLKADEEYHKEEENTLRKIIKNKEERNVELYKKNKQLKRKEQECEELKKVNEGILTTIRILAKNNIRLREILSEMKDIAEANIRIADLEGLNGVYRRGLANKILQKISEI